MQAVLITGVGKGIGKALAQKFLQEGFFVIGTFLTGRPEPQESLKDFSLDLSSSASIASCVQAITNFGRTLDVLVNCAGVLLDEDEVATVPEKLRQTLEVNLVGVVDFTERLIPLMKEGGHIVNISSTAGSLALTGEHASHFEGRYPAYKISKAALNMYTATLAKRLAPAVTVSSVHPGWVKTDMGGQDADLTPEQAAEGIYGVAMSRPATGGFWFAGQRVPW
ncbi:SDR family NAD(P)-dependent oxidoreductase [Candidatus Uhrbacteria bacterium]|nr:SDR family NAD(P)-dependent oxidoreductase [Candidatus Uhrbacteria bacterium]